MCIRDRVGMGKDAWGMPLERFNAAYTRLFDAFDGLSAPYLPLGTAHARAEKSLSLSLPVQIVREEGDARSVVDDCYAVMLRGGGGGGAEREKRKLVERIVKIATRCCACLECVNGSMCQWVNGSMWQCGNGSMWQWVNRSMWQCGNVAMGQCGNGSMWQWVNRLMWQCGNVAMWQWVNVSRACLFACLRVVSLSSLSSLSPLASRSSRSSLASFCSLSSLSFLSAFSALASLAALSPLCVSEAVKESVLMRLSLFSCPLLAILNPPYACITHTSRHNC
eukprot:208151-Rhodomonas_salina.3